MQFNAASVSHILGKRALPASIQVGSLGLKEDDLRLEAEHASHAAPAGRRPAAPVAGARPPVPVPVSESAVRGPVCRGVAADHRTREPPGGSHLCPASASPSPPPLPP